MTFVAIREPDAIIAGPCGPVDDSVPLRTVKRLAFLLPLAALPFTPEIGRLAANFLLSVSL